MTRVVLIPRKELADIIGCSENVLHTYLSHYTLFKFVRHRYKNLENKKSRQMVFLINEDSIYALQEYLKMKMRFKRKCPFKISAIEKLKKYYKEARSFDVVKNEN